MTAADPRSVLCGEIAPAPDFMPRRRRVRARRRRGLGVYCRLSPLAPVESMTPQPLNADYELMLDRRRGRPALVRLWLDFVQAIVVYAPAFRPVLNHVGEACIPYDFRDQVG